MLKAEKLTRTVPVSSVPPLRWAIGAQCSPARTAIPGLRQAGGGLLAVEVPAAERQNAALPGPVNTSTPGSCEGRAPQGP